MLLNGAIEKINIIIIKWIAIDKVAQFIGVC